MKNQLLKSTIILSVSIIVSKFLGALYRIPLSNILGAEGIGVYQMIFPLCSLFLVFCTGGVSTYLAQNISRLRAKGAFLEINKTLKIAKNMCISYGIVISALLCFFSYFISLMQGNTLATMGYIAISIGFVFSCLLGVYRGYFQGYENMIPTALSQIIEQTFKLAFGLLFAKKFLSFGLSWGVFGALTGITLSEIICYFFMLLYFSKNNTKKYVAVKKQDYKVAIKCCFPISITAIMLPLITTLDSLFATRLMTISGLDIKTSTSLFGIYSGMITPMLNFPILFISTICIALLPNLSYKIQKGENASVIIKNCLFFVWLISLPCTFGIISISSYILKILFPSINNALFDIANFSLKISSFNIIWLSIISLSSTILQAYGKYKLPCFSLAIAFLFKFFIMFFIALNTKINIVGLSIINTLIYSISALLNILFLKKITAINLSKKQVIIPAILAPIMSVCIIYLNKFVMFGNLLNFIILTTFGIVIYLCLAFMLKILDFSQIKTMIKNRKKS